MSGDITVTVAARNVVGEGIAQICTPQPIRKSFYKYSYMIMRLSTDAS